MKFSGFDWNEGNWPKCGKHGLTKEQIEFCFNDKMMVAPDSYPIEIEKRFKGINKDPEGRNILIIFTIRENALIRPISARYMQKKEIVRYEQG